MDHAAADEPRPLQAALHRHIGLVGIRPQVGQPGQRPVHRLRQHAAARAVAAQPVQRAVGRIVVPPRAVDGLIRGVVADDKGEHAVDSAAVLHHVQVAPRRVLPQQHLRWVSVHPLDGVAVGPHEPPRTVVNGQGAGQVILCCSPHHISSSGSAAARECARPGR